MGKHNAAKHSTEIYPVLDVNSHSMQLILLITCSNAATFSLGLLLDQLLLKRQVDKGLNGNSEIRCQDRRTTLKPD
jgi:hypothetical protein